MVGQLVNVGVALIVAIFFGWLFSQARRSRSSLIRWVVGIILAIPTLLVSLIAIVAILGIYRLSAPIARPVPAISASAVPPDRLAIATKRAILCAGCHSPNDKLPLS